MAITAQGATLSFTVGDTNLLDGLCIRNIGEVSHTRNTIDSTCYGSTVMQYIAGLLDLGTMEVTVAFKNSATAAAIQAAFVSGSSGTILITLNDAESTTWTASGIITGVGQTFPRDEVMETTITFQLDGQTAPAWGGGTP